jgi:hypothetical protein
VSRSDLFEVVHVASQESSGGDEPREETLLAATMSYCIGLEETIRSLRRNYLEPMSNLKEVANLAGVSISTVSLALNGRSVNADTRRRVIDCAKRLKYVPSRIGRALNSGRSNTVCLLVMTQAGLHDVFETSLMYYFLQGILRVLDRQSSFGDQIAR